MSRTSTSRRSERRLRRVEICSPECSREIDTAELSSFLQNLLPSVKVRTRRNPLMGLDGAARDRVARQLACARVKNPLEAASSYEPMFGEIEYEQRGLTGDARMGGIVYDGRRLEETLIDLLDERNRIDTAWIVLTDRLVSTYSTDDLRHHLRTVFLGFPSILSVPGIVEAPAKPRAYYMLKQQAELTSGPGINSEFLKTAFKGQFVDLGSPQMTEAAKGLALQAVMNHLTLKPFCSNKRCRLFNAHWQRDLLISQVGSPGLCTRHSALVKRMGRDPVLAW